MEKPTLKTYREQFQDITYALERKGIPLQYPRWGGCKVWSLAIEGEARFFEVLREDEYALSVQYNSGYNEMELYEFDEFDFNKLVRFLTGEEDL